MMNMRANLHRGALFTAALCRGVGFAVFLVSIFLFVGVGALFFRGNTSLVHMGPLLVCVTSGLTLMFLGELLPLVVSIAASLHAVQEELARFPRPPDNSRD